MKPHPSDIPFHYSMLILITENGVIRTITHSEYLVNTSGLLTGIGILKMSDFIRHAFHYMFPIILNSNFIL